MVIQAYMKVSDIVNSWEETKQVFIRYNISLQNQSSLKELLSESSLQHLLTDLNQAVGSSEVTCIPGG